MDEKNIIGKVDKKRVQQYEKKDGSGQGEFYVYTVNGTDFTTFSEHLKDIEIGTEVEIIYTEKQNGNYLNRNIKSMRENIPRPALAESTLKKIEEVRRTMEETGKNAADPKFAEEVEKRKNRGNITTVEDVQGTALKQEPPMGENVINVGDKTYKVRLTEI
jgi:hypothetical protein